MKVVFIDTSVLCNLLPVPGRDQDQKQVRAEMQERFRAGEQFIIPITSVIETGNFIAQLKDGEVRRGVAQRFHDLLRLIIDGKAPWVLHDIAWNSKFLGLLLEGADTKVPYVDHSMAGLGMGDLCILAERCHYQQRLGLRAEIWTRDAQLSAHR